MRVVQHSGRVDEGSPMENRATCKGAQVWLDRPPADGCQALYHL